MNYDININELDFKLKAELDEYLLELINTKGSDLHVKAGGAIRKRVKGEIIPVENKRVLDPSEALTLAKELLRGRFGELVEKKSVDFTYKLNEDYRFRVNIFFQMEGVSAVFRTIPVNPPSFEDLKLPSAVEDICKKVYRGIVLVTGPTGSGKSTTLASMINYINKHRKAHIITIEDPIEFVYRDENCIINQRSVGQDTVNFADALRGALREDPDIILVGEMRDLETIETAMHAAETGHLVLSTLHTVDAKDTINRIVAMFPGKEQNRIKLSLASVLKGIISQRLCKTLDGKGRIAALEIMLSSPRISNMILEGRDDEIYDAINESGGNSGMQTFEAHLLELYKKGIIDKKEALENASNSNDLELRLKNADLNRTLGDKDGSKSYEIDDDIIPLKPID
ncbi:twitching motility protein PilT [Campylobacter hyointestinalis subsp. hyointestinalis]|uniref:Twitching motility protein PilT n=1 Tax=Campylobacter hyointestinalis subsp. hyointestinalis TaxID=91352 RepID=A0A0S4RS24_CAMHY|nr:type IV pilus twitching motility protein PilT [Campylobacter hyointestinalis]CUU76343.1 twitching motility protein PilT [Campylobacter hyointestinalis subsp. hyointestinalis]CUU90242.1 twitching motility protein PilT [Campylobacter hyointestinalis subsp. hyointestinalis]